MAGDPKGFRLCPSIGNEGGSDGHHRDENDQTGVPLSQVMDAEGQKEEKV